MTGLQQLCSLVTNRPNKRVQHERTGEFIVYYRVSTKRQEESQLGLLAQRKAAETYVGQQGGKIVAEYQETETGKNCKRPEIIKAILHAHRSCATLVIAKIDRLSRNVWFTSTLMESGVDFVACDNPQATRFSVHIMAAMAEEEARMISERTKAALAAYKAKGGVLGPASFKDKTTWESTLSQYLARQ